MFLWTVLQMTVKMIVQILVPKKGIRNETETLQQILEFYAVFNIIIQSPRWVLIKIKTTSPFPERLDFRLQIIWTHDHSLYNLEYNPRLFHWGWSRGNDVNWVFIANSSMFFSSGISFLRFKVLIPQHKMEFHVYSTFYESWMQSLEEIYSATNIIQHFSMW